MAVAIDKAASAPDPGAMTILGAIFAGGAARRFGGDKHAALIADRAMIDHVAGRMAGQCDAIIIVGRSWPGLTRVDDVPAPGLGPLGALAGALTYAHGAGYNLVLTSGCDLPDLPLNLAVCLAPAPAVVAGQPLLGLWPSASADALVSWLSNDGDRSMRAWIAQAGARRVALAADPANINTQADLARYTETLMPPEGRRSSR